MAGKLGGGSTSRPKAARLRDPPPGYVYGSFPYMERKHPRHKRKNNLFQIGKGKSELQLRNEIIGGQFKKGNKHKDDYVYFYFEKNKGYVDMGKAKTKMCQFLDF